MTTIAVAGATGELGRAVCGAARRLGWRVKALGRNPARLKGLDVDEYRVVDFRDVESLARALAPDDVVFSSVGASVSPWIFDGRAGYMEVDYALNLNLLRAAESVRAGRFAYVSTAHDASFSNLAYVRAHEAVARKIEQSPIAGTIVRPTGFFSAFRHLLRLAGSGVYLLFGNPEARTNPIHDCDLAERILVGVEREESEFSVGGPEVLTRREIGALALAASSCGPRLVTVSDETVKLGAYFARWFSPRLSQIAQFYLAVNSCDVVAPPFGERRLADFLQECTRPRPASSPF